MKRSDLSKAIGAGILAAGLAMVQVICQLRLRQIQLAVQLAVLTALPPPQLLAPMSTMLRQIAILTGDGWDCLACPVC